MSAPVKFYYDLLSQPSRALYIFFKLAKIPVDENPIALRKGKKLQSVGYFKSKCSFKFLLRCTLD